MSAPIDLSSWKPREFCLAAEIMIAVKNDKMSSKLGRIFDWKTMKIGFNPNSGYVYMFDDDGNQAMVFDGVLHLVDDEANVIDEEKQKEETNEDTISYTIGKVVD
jgi:hypothetical protein